MGNCSPKSCTSSKPPSSIRILTDSGQILALQGPKFAQEVLDDFPGYGIFRRGKMSLPLFDDELLQNGEAFYLLPFGARAVPPPTEDSSTFPNVEVLPSRGNGFWRVRVAMTSNELEEILSEQVSAERLIEKMRMAAGGGSGVKLKQPAVKNSWGFGFEKGCTRSIDV